MRKIVYGFVLLFLAIFIAGCANANAGQDKRVASGAEVTLDGSRSSSTENRPLLYKWSQIEGAEVEILDDNESRARFTAPIVSSESLLAFALTVTEEGTGHKSIAIVRITVLPDGSPDTTKPVITLLGDDNITIHVGDPYQDAGATATDDVDGNLTANIITTGNVDNLTEGTYTLVYNVSDAAGNAADPVSRTVTVIFAETAVVDENFTIELDDVPGYSADMPINEQYLAVINYLRGLSVRCDDPLALAGPVDRNLTWNDNLENAAEEHSIDMLEVNVLSHSGSGDTSDITGQSFDPPRRSTMEERIVRNGYDDYGFIGENVANRISSEDISSFAWVQAMEGWMKSKSGHCSNIMNPRFQDFGMSEKSGIKTYEFDDGVSQEVHVAYWTQNFGVHRMP